MSGAMIELRRVTAGYGRAMVLRDVDLTVAPGEVVALLGPNGAGKTTVIRTVSGQIRPIGGTVHVDGRDVTAVRPERRARAGLGTVPEGRGVFPSLSVRDNLVLQSPRGGFGEGVAAALEAFPDLRDRMNQRAGSLSGGQQQMLALARCFSGSPRAVLLDEVSMGLAPRVIDQIFAAIDALSARGVAMLLVEQYVTRALARADRVYVLDRGRITFEGAPSGISEDELTERYLHGRPTNPGEKSNLGQPAR